MKKKEKKLKQKGKGFFTDFKAFISRGNVVDLAVGVVIGTAFTAIVNGLVNILLNLCMWGVPGGLKGLVTVLPPASASQQAPKVIVDSVEVQLENVYSVSDFLSNDAFSSNAATRDLYELHGSKYYFKGAAILDWGTLINAALTFITVAFVLFIVIRAVGYFKRVKEEAIAKAREEYYKKHPEARPAPVDPEAPQPTELEVLTEIRDLLAKKK